MPLVLGIALIGAAYFFFPDQTIATFKAVGFLIKTLIQEVKG